VPCLRTRHPHVDIPCFPTRFPRGYSRPAAAVKHRRQRAADGRRSPASAADRCRRRDARHLRRTFLWGLGGNSPLSTDAEPGAGDSAVAAGGATTRRMRRRARKNEVAHFTTCWSENQALPAGTDAAVDVSEILLEHFDGQAKILAEVVELPLALSQSFDDLLTPGAPHLRYLCHRTGYAGRSGRIGGFLSSASRTSAIARSSCGSPPFCISDGSSTTSMSGSTP